MLACGPPGGLSGEDPRAFGSVRAPSPSARVLYSVLGPSRRTGLGAPVGTPIEGTLTARRVEGQPAQSLLAQRVQHRRRCHLRRWLTGPGRVSPHLARPGDVPGRERLVISAIRTRRPAVGLRAAATWVGGDRPDRAR